MALVAEAKLMVGDAIHSDRCAYDRSSPTITHHQHGNFIIPAPENGSIYREQAQAGF